MLDDVIYCYLVGFRRQISPVIPTLVNWLERAIENDERFGWSRSFHLQTLSTARGLARWVNDEAASTADWACASEAVKSTFDPTENVWGDQTATAGLDDYLACCCQAGLYEAGIEAYEELTARRAFSLKKALQPRDFGYALCLHHARGQFDEASIFEAGRRALKSRLSGTWLGKGQAIRAAMWLKIVYWDRDWRAGRASTMTPLQTLLKAYENMPNVNVPSFVDINAR